MQESWINWFCVEMLGCLCSLCFSFVFFKHLVWPFVYCLKVGTKFSSLLIGFNIGYHFGALTFYRITMNMILSPSGMLGQIKINIWILDPCCIWLICGPFDPHTDLYLSSLNLKQGIENSVFLWILNCQLHLNAVLPIFRSISLCYIAMLFFR